MASFTDIFLDVTKDGHKIPRENYLPQGKYPIIDQGQEYIAGYSNEASGLYKNVPAIIFGDHTRIVKYVDTPCFLGADGVKLLKAKAPDANTKYLYYALSHARIPNTGYNRHFKWLKEVNIRLPEKNEQQHIVSVLDILTGLISLRKQQLAKLDELIKARFIEMFGDPVENDKNWPVQPLICLGELNRGVSKARPRNSPDLLGGKYPLIQTGEVANAGTYITTYESTYSEKGLLQSKMWPKGTLCITIAANIAQTAILAFDACFPDSVVGFVAGTKTNAFFIHFWFKFFQKILEEQAPQVAQKNINLKILSGLQVIVPPLALQTQFAAFVEATEKSKMAVKKSLEKLETLKKSLMQEYFM
ncbi:MAG: restriction endonuclease subunit S [Oscillospiraceae bacterium]|nr:restriction endonuclease subunit S [Oscillospiraceae bacterium]